MNLVSILFGGGTSEEELCLAKKIANAKVLSRILRQHARMNLHLSPHHCQREKRCSAATASQSEPSQDRILQRWYGHWSETSLRTSTTTGPSSDAALEAWELGVLEAHCVQKRQAKTQLQGRKTAQRQQDHRQGVQARRPVQIPRTDSARTISRPAGNLQMAAILRTTCYL